MEEGWDWARHADNQNAIRKKHTHTHTFSYHLWPWVPPSFHPIAPFPPAFVNAEKTRVEIWRHFPASDSHRRPIVTGPSSGAHRRRRPRGRHFPSHSADGNHTADFHRHLIQEHGTENRATQRRRLETNQIQPVGGHIGHFRSGDGPSATGNAPWPSRRPPTTYWEMFYKSMIRKMTTNPSVSEKIPSTRSQEAIWAENTFRFPAARSPCSPAAGKFETPAPQTRPATPRRSEIGQPIPRTGSAGFPRKTRMPFRPDAKPSERSRATRRRPEVATRPPPSTFNWENQRPIPPFSPMFYKSMLRKMAKDQCINFKWLKLDAKGTIWPFSRVDHRLFTYHLISRRRMWPCYHPILIAHFKSSTLI